jgi:hypothetical protein
MLVWLLLVSLWFLRLNFLNFPGFKQEETTARNVGRSGHRRNVDVEKGVLLAQEGAGMVLPDILLAKPKEIRVQGERTLAVV